MTDLMTTAGVKIVIRETCEKLGHPDFANKITVSWNSRAKTRFGLARSPRNDIEFGVYLFGNATTAEKIDTIQHETCHLVAHHLHGYNIKPHGHEWKALARKAGCTPRSGSKSYKIDTSKPPARGMHRVFCNCGPMDVTTRFRNCLLRGNTYSCRTCKHWIAIKEADVCRRIGNRAPAPVKAPQPIAPIVPISVKALRDVKELPIDQLFPDEMKAEILRLRKENEDLRNAQRRRRAAKM